MKTVLSITILAVALTACGKPESVSFETLEQERGTARKNAMYNAQKFRATNPLLSEWDIIGNGDSTQTAVCPTGDGWATMDFVRPDKTKIVPVKCSTVSANVGCLLNSDFKSKPYASEDGHCQKSKLPSPLPKIQQ